MWEIGERIDNQFVVLEHYEGGTGVVLVLLDELTRHKFAAKTLKPELVDNPNAMDRFRQEARAWLGLGRHDNLVHAVIYRELDGKPLLFIEYVDGMNLGELLRRERVLDLGQAVDFALQIAATMEYLHTVGNPSGEEGLIHRDLKPANVLIDRRGVAKVTDFGLAKVQGGLASLMEGRKGLGTLPYMPPEQVLDAASADRRSDVYSFGATLYHMITGKQPVDTHGDNPIGAILHRVPAAPTSLNPNIPEALDALVMRCLAKQREERYPTFHEVLTELRAIRRELDKREYAAAWQCRSCGYRSGRHHADCPVCAQSDAAAKGEDFEEAAEEAVGAEAETAGASAQELRRRALELRQAGRVDQALALLRRASALAPEDDKISRALDETALAATRERPHDETKHYNWPAEGCGPTRTGYTPETVAPPLKLIWTAQVAEWFTAPPVMANGMIYVGGHTTEPGKYGSFAAVNAADGTIAWDLRAHKEFLAAACIVGGKVAYVASGPRLASIDAMTGKPTWDGDMGADIFGSPIVVGNLVVVAASNGRVAAFNTQTGQRSWAFEAGGQMLCGPTASEDTVWVGGSGCTVYALDVLTGQELWTYATGGEIQAPCAYLRGSLLVASLDHRVHCLHAFNGRRRWEFECDGEIHSSPAGWENTVVVGTRERCVYGIAADTGHRKWRFATDDWVDAAPSISGRTVYIGSHDGHLYALERESGILLWRQDLGCELSSGAAISMGYVVVAGRDGKVYCFRSRAQ
jgi:outer membrane protein assembly factor BamB/predicted Zn-ribbon and HTH transcriptional regulator